MSEPNNNIQQEKAPDNNNNDKNQTQPHEETENKLSSELDELIIDKKKLAQKKNQIFNQNKIYKCLII